MPTRADIERIRLNTLALKAFKQGGLSEQDVSESPELAAKAIDMAKAKRDSAVPSAPTPKESTMPNTSGANATKPRMMSEQDIFNALSASTASYQSASPEDRAVYDSIIAKKKKKATSPDTVPVISEATATSAGATPMKKEPTAAELISHSINSFSESIVGALSSRGGM